MGNGGSEKSSNRLKVTQPVSVRARIQTRVGLTPNPIFFSTLSKVHLSPGLFRPPCLPFLLSSSWPSLRSSKGQWWNFKHCHMPLEGDVLQLAYLSGPSNRCLSKVVRSDLSQSLGFVCKNVVYGYGTYSISSISQSRSSLQTSGIMLFPFLKWGG